MTTALKRPRKPEPGTRLVNRDGQLTDRWQDYFNRLEDYMAALEARLKALEV